MTETLVITDLDGSFWDRHLRCHPDTLAAVAGLRARRVPLLVATGRREGSARRGLIDNGLSLPAVLLNGTLGIDLPTGIRFHTHPFTTSDAERVIDALAEVGISPVVYTSDGLVRGGRSVATGHRHRAGFGEDYVVEEPAITVATSPILSFAMIGMGLEDVEPAVAAMAGVPADVLLYEDHLYRAWSVHIQPTAISKWNGIQSYLAYAGLEPERIVAIGDGTNDLEMLVNADVSIGVTGGHAEVLEVVDHVVPAPHEGGWKRVLDHL